MRRDHARRLPRIETVSPYNDSTKGVTVKKILILLFVVGVVALIARQLTHEH